MNYHLEKTGNAFFKVTLPNEKKWCRQRFSMHPAVLWEKKAAEKNAAHVFQS